ncbi:nicotinamide riboside transporter PnuC [Streptomyces sp. NPDC059740]|uniref:nicotinamide riboside transporter PnuC n=1 Tax=Streptomyces sp. NPDC059740 TaxID=3346926 RepID=UPI0036480225
MSVPEAFDRALAALNHPLFTLGQDAVSWAELAGFVTAGACVWLCVRATVWNFPVGIANNLFFLVLFWSTRLYADAALQVVYLALAAAGWWQWRHGGEGGERRVGRASPRQLAWLLALLVPATAVLTATLTAAGDAAPFWDALTTALSLAAQWLLNAKLQENWYLWIAADVVYVPLYLVRGLDLTALVYALLLVMCLVGLRDWRRIPAPVTPAATEATA